MHLEYHKMLFWGQIPGVQFFFLGAEAELTNRVLVRDFDPGAPLTYIY